MFNILFKFSKLLNTNLFVCSYGNNCLDKKYNKIYNINGVIDLKEKRICSNCQYKYPIIKWCCPNCGHSPEEIEKQFEELKKSNEEYREKIKNGTIKNPNLTSCSACNKEISKQAEVCPHCGQPTGVHLCPKCKSTDTKVISGASKVASVAMWGVFAANKVKSNYKCNKCGHKF